LQKKTAEKPKAGLIMKILYDHQIFSLQKHGGISRYFCEMMARFSKDTSIDYSVALRFSQNEHLLSLPQLNPYWSHKSILHSHTHIVSAVKTAARYESFRFILTNAVSYVNQQESEQLIKKQDFDLVHPTYYNPYFLRFLQKKPYVITVYDMIHEIFPDYFPLKDPISSWKKQVLENADAIISISESTKADIIRLFHIDPERIAVIHLGNPLEDTTDAAPCKDPDPVFPEKPYILFVGNRIGYKNFDFFIKAAAEILHKNRALQVYCAGGGPFTPQENEALKNLQILPRVHYVTPNDLLMKNLYTNARAFVFPSLYEGFGLPVLEAFSSGCPVMASNSSSLPEIGGDAAIYFDPSDAASFTNAMDRLLSDDNLRMQLIIKGYDRLKQFSWEKTTGETKRVYEKVDE
jgi:glycosyltransferase involved in cell wall biosynthesis